MLSRPASSRWLHADERRGAVGLGIESPGIILMIDEDVEGDSVPREEDFGDVVWVVVERVPRMVHEHAQMVETIMKESS